METFYGKRKRPSQIVSLVFFFRPKTFPLVSRCDFWSWRGNNTTRHSSLVQRDFTRAQSEASSPFLLLVPGCLVHYRGFTKLGGDASPLAARQASRRARRGRPTAEKVRVRASAGAKVSVSRKAAQRGSVEMSETAASR